MSFIGPSNCDSERTKREKELNTVWNKLVSSHTFLPTQLIFIEAIDLYREALSCYQNGAFMATSIMCRASTECAVYLAISRKNFKYSTSWKTIHKSDTITIEKDDWKILVKRGKDEKILDNRTMQILDKIRNQGNFVAHYGSRKDKTLRKLSEDILSPTSSSIQKKRNHLLSELIFDKKMALNNLEWTRTVLGILMEKILSLSNSS